MEIKLREMAKGLRNFSRATLVSLCLVIFASGISLRLIIKSSHQTGAEQNVAIEAANSPPAASSAAPTLSAAPGRVVDSQEAKRNGSATANPQLDSKSAQKPAAEITARGKLRALGMGRSAQTDAGLRQPKQNGLRQNRLAQSSVQGPPRGTKAPVAEERASNSQSSGMRETGSPGNVRNLPPIKPSEDGKLLTSQAKPDEGPAAIREEPKTDLRPDKRPAPSASLFGSDVSSKDANSKTLGVRGTRLPGGAAESNQSAQSGTVSTQGTITSGPEVVQLVGPVSQDIDLRELPYIPPKTGDEELRLTRHPKVQNQGMTDPALPVRGPAQPSAMPAPIQNFGGITAAASGCGCLPPDTDGDVGPNHYIQSVNSSIKIFDKTGGTLSGPTTYNSFFSALGTSTPCGSNQNDGDGFVFYDHLANRWVVSDFAFPAFPGTSFYQCVGVSKTSDPVAGGWWLYAVPVDPANQTFLGDYPKFGLWPDAYYLSVNLFSSPTTFNGVRVFALPRSAMINGTGAPNAGAVAFTITPADLGDAYSLLPATFRTGSAPPAGTPEYFMAINSSATAGTVETQVFTWRFHVDFTTPANSTFGIGAGHTANNATTVNGFVDAFTSTTLLVPQDLTPRLLDTLGDKLMTPLVYQNLSGTESLWASHTINNNQNGTGPTAIRWYQFNVTGGIVPAVPLQQQTFNNGADGLWRWMPSIAVDGQGNMSIGYTTSSGITNPAINYAGRLATDPLNSLAQGEALLIQGAGHQTSASGRWGDYSALAIDPSDSCTFWHTNEYYSATSMAGWNTRIGSFKFPSCSVPTEAKVKTFTADGFNDGRVLLRWSSGYEVDNLGYNVYRETNGQRTKINPQTIAGSALVTGPKVALTAGKSYAWGDLLTQGATSYWLEDIDLSGKSSWTGPINLNATGGEAPSVEQSVLLTRIGLASAQMTLGQGSTPVERKAEIASVTPAAIKLQTTLAGEPAVKLAVKQEGWYRITQQDLVAAGLSSNVDARNLRLYVDGAQVPMIVNGEQDGRLDPSDSIEFYGVGLNSATTNTHVYWLVAGGQNGARIKALKTAGGQAGPVSFVAAVERKDRTLYFSGLRNGETENFFGPVVASAAVDQSLTLTNLASTSSPATLDVYLQGVTLTPHQAQVTLNGVVVGTVSFNGQERGTASFPIAQSQLREGVNSVQLIAQGGSSDISLVDTVRVSYTHTFTADNDQLRAAVKSGQRVTIAGFTSSDVRVMDVTDLNNPQELTGTISGSRNNSSITLTPPGAGVRSLLAFTGARAMSAVAKANVPSNWHEEGLQHDYVMITTQDLKPSLGPLKALRESQGLSVAVVDVEDLYDEFSFGNKSPQAIKDFLQFTRDNWRRLPRLVLFAGDSSYDPKNYLGFGDSDLVPTKLFDSAHMEAASDDWFVDFQGTGLPEIASGRLPVRNATEATALVGKILSYESSTGANSVLLTSDLDDGHNFAANAAALRTLLPGGMQVQEVVRGTSDDATVKSQILEAINQGKTIVNYDGHGSVNQWRGNILTNGDAASLTNSQKLAFFVMMTCLNGYFDDPVLDSLAESLLKASGGAAAVWASAAQCEPGAQEALNQELYRLLFSGSAITVGEAAARAKQVVTDPDVRRSWILFGDPAMRLK